jgi:hypothetical protein
MVLAVVVAIVGCGGPGARVSPVSRPLATAVQTSPWQTPFGPYTLYTTPHYRLYSTVTRKALMSVAPGFMEAAHDRYAQLTGLGDRVTFQPERNFVRMGSLRTALVQHRWIPVEELVAMDGGDAVQNRRPGVATPKAMSASLASAMMNALESAFA